MEFPLSGIDRQSKINILVDEDFASSNTNVVNFIYIIDGDMEVSIENRKAIYSKKNFVIVNKYDSLEMKKLSSSALYLVIEFSDFILSQSIFIDNIKFNGNSLSIMDKTQKELVGKVIHRLFELLLLNEERAKFSIYSTIYELLSIMTTNFLVFSKFNNKKNIKNREIIKYIYLHHTEVFSLADIARHFFMETSYFSRYFKKHFGLNFKDYLMGVRMSYVEKDLIFTENSIARIAMDNGFSNIASFNRAFNAYHGQSPSAFRRDNRDSQSQKLNTANPIDYSRLNLRYKQLKVDSLDNVTKDDVVTIRIPEDEGQKILPVWDTILNIGCAEDLLNDGLKNHIGQIQDALTFQFARIWMVFSENLYVDWTEGHIVNFDKFNDIFDSILEARLVPWIAINKEVTKKKRMNEMTQFSYERWHCILSDFATHMVDRYGVREVEKWKFEIIVENTEDCHEVEVCGQIFYAAQKVLKAISPKINIGGSGFKGVISKERLSNIAEELGFREFDFYTVMIYPYLKNIGKDGRELQRITSADHLATSIELVKKVLSDFPKKPLYISEWNVTVSNHNLINDSLFKGSYVLKNVLNMLGKVSGTGFWGASDLNYLRPEDANFLVGGSGLLNKFGIPKPSFFAFKFLNELKGRELLSFGENYIVCRDEGELHILLFHYAHPNHFYFIKREDKILPLDIEKFFEKDKIKMTFSVENIPEGHYDIRTFICNGYNGSLLDLWEEFDFATNLRKTDYLYLEQKNMPSMSLKMVDVAPSSSLRIEQGLKTNTFVLINILKRQK